jgi:hypothetical protein
MTTELSNAELSKKSHAELKELCREAGVAVSGTKAKLIENILNGPKKKARTNEYHPAVSATTSTSSNKPINPPSIHEHFRTAAFMTGIQRINSPPKQARSERSRLLSHDIPPIQFEAG